MAFLPAIANARRQIEAFRSQTGITVRFRETDYIVRSSEISGSMAGQAGVDRGTLDQFIGNTAPRVFSFNASEFAPNADEDLPEVGEFIECFGWAYQITHTDADAQGDDAFSIRCYALKAIYPTAAT